MHIKDQQEYLTNGEKVSIFIVDQVLNIKFGQQENAFVCHTKDCNGEKLKAEMVRCYSRAMDFQIEEWCCIQRPEADAGGVQSSVISVK